MAVNARGPDSVLLAWKVEVSEGFDRGQTSAAGMKDVENAIEPTRQTFAAISEGTAWRRDPVVPPGGVLMNLGKVEFSTIADARQ